MGQIAPKNTSDTSPTPIYQNAGQMSHRRPTQKHCIYHQTARWAVIPTGVLSDKTPYPAIYIKSPFSRLCEAADQLSWIASGQTLSSQLRTREEGIHLTFQDQRRKFLFRIERDPEAVFILKDHFV